MEDFASPICCRHLMLGDTEGVEGKLMLFLYPRCQGDFVGWKHTGTWLLICLQKNMNEFHPLQSGALQLLLNSLNPSVGGKVIL